MFAVQTADTALFNSAEILKRYVTRVRVHFVRELYLNFSEFPEAHV